MRLVFGDVDRSEAGEGLTIMNLTGVGSLWVVMNARPQVEGQAGGITTIIEQSDDGAKTWSETFSCELPSELGGIASVRTILAADVKDAIRARWTISGGVWSLDVDVQPLVVDKNTVLSMMGDLQGLGLLRHGTVIL